MVCFISIIRATIAVLLLTCFSTFAYSAEQTLTLQQGLDGYSGVADTYVRDDDWATPFQYSRNYGRTDRLRVLYNGSNNPLLRFDLSTLPANSTIISATLSLFNTTNSGGQIRNIRLHRVLRDWHVGNQNNSIIDAPGEYGVTGQKAFDFYNEEGTDVFWNAIAMQSGTDLSAIPESETAVESAGWYNWDMTTLLDSWIQGQANYGLTLRDPDGWYPPNGWYPGNILRDFHSSEYTQDTSLRPKLTIVYDSDGTTTGGNLSAKQAARFLTQTTFGSTLDDIDHLVSLGSYEAWLAEQFNEPASLQLQAIKSLIRRKCMNPDVIDGEFQESRIDAWWNTAINGNDQLRQRVAFALSEIFVVSAVEPPLKGSQFGMADYNDMLAKNAFGNYRNLLEDVTLHPVMGIYLSMLHNRKAQSEQNIRPDENYAREVMQLFSIGLHELNLDGTLKQLNGKPIPTFDQNDVEAFARVFTGWKFANANWDIYVSNGDRTVPMVPFEEFHDITEKHLLDGQVLAAGQTAQQDLDAALDNLFNHPNVAPFISKQLIQRLVTSNPSTGYVERVAIVFNDNGQGQRGDLKAVIKAILLDTEARNGHLNSTTFGKLREPILRLSHLRRAFPAIPVVREGERWGSGTCGEDSYELYITVLPFPWDFQLVFGQDMLRAPSVFNFFRPDFSPPGSIRNQGLVAPEFQIMTENTLTGSYRTINFEIQNSGESRNLTVLNTAWAEALADDTEALLDKLDLVLLSGSMPAEMRTILADHLNNANFPTDVQQRRVAKVRDTISLIISTPNYLIQQ